MSYEIREMSGSLFKNDKKTADNHPSARGSCKINGVEYWVDAWTKTDKNGNKWQSLAFKPKEARQAPKSQTSTPSRATVGGGSDPDYPF